MTMASARRRAPWCRPLLALGLAAALLGAWATQSAATVLPVAAKALSAEGKPGGKTGDKASGKAADSRLVRIALIADLPQWPDAEAPTQQLLDNLAQRKLAFVIHAGGIKGDTESCADAMLAGRLRLLDQSPLPLVYIPGETDWAECEQAVNGSFDPDERLARLRELAFPDDDSLGQRRLRLIRQSDQAKFRSYRENVRWTAGKALLVGMNVPDDNNHYRTEAGRNGEFEDRREANRQWLARAFSAAEQESLDGIVLVIHGDPQFGNGWEKRGKPTLLDGFLRHRQRDGYLEFKRQLRELVSDYRGQVLLIHSSIGGFGIDTPLRDAKGKTIRSFTRVALPVGSPKQWTELTISPDSRSLFSVALQDGAGKN
ncbi:hypothetical protein K7G19_21455 [Cupriavidus sp. DB3]|uniref:hypothetical protein n=1 Tax=Cupriavidus sp. DB3 TaxID=2873259 RepID=UPI001CF55D9D|nr:hypothetical protein [Cupriavidus sp. DB3]MCA7086160.1 hypothetical protein [Cupriavidus sp. DB3]